MGKNKKNKACGPDCLPIEVAKALGDEGAIWMTGVLNEAMRKGIPKEWRTSTITHIYKQKGDPLEYNNFRGIKLLSHTLKFNHSFNHSHSGATGVFRNAVMAFVAEATSCLPKTLQTT